MSDVKRTGAAGGAGMPGGYAGATNYGTADLTNSAEAYGGQGGGAGGGAYAGATTKLASSSTIYAAAKAVGGAGGTSGAYNTTAGAGGAGLASAAANNTGTGDATAAGTAIGGTGGGGTGRYISFGGHGGAGGAATVHATAYARSGTASATANATGGTGGNGSIGGAGGIAINTTAFASGYNASATVNQTGGTGGSGISQAGAGGNSTLQNAVSGATTGGTLTLIQTATGGGAGSSAGNIGSKGGDGSSTLNFSDATASVLTGTVNGAGGDGGFGFGTGGAGGAGTASITLSGANAVYATANANGGTGGANGTYGNDHYGGGGAGGSAQASATANSSSAHGTATATAVATGGTSYTSTTTGGAGGNVHNVSAAATGYNAYASAQAIGGAGGSGVYGGAGGVASGTTAVASGFNASASVSQTGGAGGDGILGGTDGAASTLYNAVSGSANGGSLTLSQTAIGGAGGATFRNGGQGLAGGIGSSTLRVSDTTASILTGIAAATGGYGGFGDAGGVGGAAIASIALSGASAVYATAEAAGGTAGFGLVTGGTGGYGTATAAAISTGTGAGATAQATANASGGGRSPGDFLGARGGGNATATATTVDGQLALANAMGSGSSGSVEATAQTGGSGPVTAVSSISDAQFGGASTDAESAVQSGAVLGFAGAAVNAYAFATEVSNTNYVTQVLSSSPDLESFFSNGFVFGAASQGTLSAGDITTLHDYRSTTDWTIDTTALSGELVLGLVDNEGFGSGPIAVEFRVSVGGSTVADQTFTSIAAAEGFFHDAAIDLGPVVATAALRVDITFDLKTIAPDVGLGAEFLLGTTEEARPPLVSGAGNTVFWTEGDPPVAIDSALTLSYLGGPTVDGATVSIGSGYLSGDTLSFTAPSGSGITGSISGGTLTLSGTASIAAYQAVLDSVTFSSTSLDPTESGADSQRTITWQVQGTLVSSTVDVGQIYALTTGVDIIHAGAGNDIIDAAGDTLTAGDIIDGGGGSNQIILQGAGLFDLAAPATLANIQTVVAKEGQAASPGFDAQDETVNGRAGTALTLTIKANPAPNAGNPNPSTITINEADNFDTVNLGPGTDIITVGGSGETINSGGGSDTFIVNRDTIGATINASSSFQDLLEVTGGGTITMGNSITNLFQVDLLPATTDYDFTAAAAFGLNVNDLSTTTNDTLRAGAGFQLFTGGGAGKVTFVASPAGQDIYEDAAEVFNGDSLVNFDVGVNALIFTDIDPATAQLGYTQDNADSGTLTVSDGTHSASLTLFGHFAVTGFELLPNGASTVVEYIPGPTANNGAVTEGHGQTVDLTALINSLVVLGFPADTATLTSVNAVLGQTVLGANDTVTYTAPDAGPDTITYTVVDRLGTTATGQVTVTVDLGPTANNGAVTEGHDQTIDLSGLIKGLVVPGIAGDSETLTSVGASFGTAVLGANNMVTYTAPATGSDAITYSVVDQYGDAATGQVTVTVDPGPTAATGATAVGPGKTVDLSALINGLIVPGIAGDTETLTSVDATSGTAVLGAYNTVTYTAPATGSDTITYRVADQYGDAATGQVTVTVDPGPTAAAGATTVGHGKTVDLTGLINGLVFPGLPGDTETLTSVTAAQGIAMLGGGNMVAYTAPATGPDTITYSVADQYGDTATGTVDVTVDPGPVAATGATTVGHGKTVDLTGLINGLVSPGLPGDSETLTGVTAAHGTVVLGANSTVTYTAPTSGPDTIAYSVTDQYGDTASGTVDVTVDPGPTAKSASITVATGAATDLTGYLLSLAAPGLPGDTLTISGDSTAGTRGTVTLLNGDLTYTAPPAAGSDSFVYTVSDQYGDTASATVRITAAASAEIGNGSGTIVLGDNSVTIRFGNGAVNVVAGNGNDTITGGNGSDTVTAGNGNDRVTLGNGNDGVNLGNGNDTVNLGNGDNSVTLGTGSSRITAGNGANAITIAGSTASTNIITAGNGNNTMTLGAGAFDVTVGNGRDTFIFENGGTYNIAAGHGTPDLFIFTAVQGLLKLSFGSNDELVFRNSGFDLGADNGRGTATPRAIAPALFSPNTNGTFATTSNRFAYDQSTGALFYDAQGSTPASTNTEIAMLSNRPHLTAASLFFTS